MMNITSLFLSFAYAQEAATAAPKGPSVWESLVIPMGAFFLIFYFLVIRPQAKKAKETQAFLSALKKGDQVLTAGGIFGTIVGVTEKFVDVKVSDNTRLKVLKSSVSAFESQTNTENQKKN